MQKRIMYLMLMGLAACTSQYGNYAHMSDADNTALADDTVHKLNRLYPPAATHLLLLQSPQDAYGTELVKALRENGYALEDGTDSLFSSAPPAPAVPNEKPDWSKNSKNVEPSTAIAPVKTKELGSAQGGNRSISYIVDRIGEGLYRVTVSIDSNVLSRVYMSSGSSITPAGSWTRKE